MLVVGDEASQKRGVFLDAVFEGLEGYLCLATIRRGAKNVFKEEFFRWPAQRDKALEFAQKYVAHADLYFCPTLLVDPIRTKENVELSLYCWADLDSCSPSKVRAKPTFVIESSPNRYQALWKLTEPVSAFDAEAVNHRIAYAHEQEGADKSGWDLSQLLRLPFSVNFKYGPQGGEMVKIVEVNSVEYTLDELQEVYPQVSGYQGLDIAMPDPTDLPQDAEAVLAQYRTRLQPLVFHLYTQTPEQDWSKALWQLEMFCAEAGMSREETFVVARESACNKYRRDDISEVQLWKEVCRAHQKQEEHLAIMAPANMQPLLTDEQRARVAGMRTFVDDYIDWAKGIGDAAPQYHEAGAFIILSSLLAGPIKLPTSFGTIVPNLWFMILADTTLTRKSTAMDLAMDLINEIDNDAVMATDGSIEGLFAALQYRPGRPSIFLRDEFSGLLEMMTKKDYYAGMAETFTKLYDGKFQKRILRRDIIEVRDPVLILFAGGIRERILQLLQYEHVASGFLPRFVFVTAESDISRLRPLGPPTEATLEGRGELIQRLLVLHGHYTSPTTITVNGKPVSAPPDHKASLTPQAWALYNKLETDMMSAALASKQPDLMTPMFDRLSKSGLKAAVLLAALRCESHIEVTEDDLLKAFSYVERWRVYGMEIIENIGRTTSERNIQNVHRTIKKSEGITRSEVMQRYHMTAREAEQVLMTLEQRGLISRVKSGRTERLYPTAIPTLQVSLKGVR